MCNYVHDIIVGIARIKHVVMGQKPGICSIPKNLNKSWLMDANIY